MLNSGLAKSSLADSVLRRDLLDQAAITGRVCSSEHHRRPQLKQTYCHTYTPVTTSIALSLA